MPPPRGLIQWVDQELHQNEGMPRGAPLLVAVSGGADSVGLLRILHALNRSRYWRWTLVVGHVEHGIRGAASVADAKFVRALARTLDLRCVVKRLHLGRGASEASARAARLRALKSIVKAHRCAGVVMGHHADDQAETVLLRLMRGCGIDGLAGIAPVRNVDGLLLYRPLLGVRRAAVREYLAEIGQSWREDQTNHSDAYLRNRVRAEILPAMEAMAGGAVAAIARTAVLAGEARDMIDARVQRLLSEAVVAETKRRVSLRRELLRESHPFLCGEALRVAVTRVGGSTETADFERVREAVRVVRNRAGGKVVQMGGGVALRVAAGSVVVERKARP